MEGDKLLEVAEVGHPKSCTSQFFSFEPRAATAQLARQNGLERGRAVQDLVTNVPIMTAISIALFREIGLLTNGAGESALQKAGIAQMVFSSVGLLSYLRGLLKYEPDMFQVILKGAIAISLTTFSISLANINHLLDVSETALRIALVSGGITFTLAVTSPLIIGAASRTRMCLLGETTPRSGEVISRGGYRSEPRTLRGRVADIGITSFLYLGVGIHILKDLFLLSSPNGIISPRIIAFDVVQGFATAVYAFFSGFNTIREYRNGTTNLAKVFGKLAILLGLMFFMAANLAQNYVNSDDASGLLTVRNCEMAGAFMMVAGFLIETLSELPKVVKNEVNPSLTSGPTQSP